MQHANQTITYYALDKDGRAEVRTILHGVSCTHKTVSTATEKGAVLSQVVICRVPVENAPVGFLPQENDMLVTGQCESEDVGTAELKHIYHAVTVKAVSDDRGGLSPHWKLEAV